MLDLGIKKILHGYTEQIRDPDLDLITGDTLILLIHGISGLRDSELLRDVILSSFAAQLSQLFAYAHMFTSFLLFSVVHVSCSTDFHYTRFVLDVNSKEARNVHKFTIHDLCTLPR